MLSNLIALHRGSNSAVALFGAGGLEFAAAEERFSRRRFHVGAPTRGLSELKQRFPHVFNGLKSEVASTNRDGFLPMLLPDSVIRNYEPKHQSPRFLAHVALQEILSITPGALGVGSRVTQALMKREHPDLVHLSDHHTAHVYSAYFTSGFSEATGVTVDGFGDGASAKVFACSQGDCRELYSSSALGSPGLFYGDIAQQLGIDPRLAGKVTGLAAYGDPAPAYSVMERLLWLSKDRRRFHSPPIHRRGKNGQLYAELKSFSDADIAAAAQKRLEDVVIPFVLQAIRDGGQRDLVLAGGVFANVKLVQKLSELTEVGQIHVHPAMDDHGLAVGAGFEYLSKSSKLRPSPLASIYLGPDYSKEECADALERWGIPFSEKSDIEAEVAELLAQGKVVVRFKGRMEYGSRALGNRSILYRSDDPAVNEWLNHHLRRNEYMPFAPVTLGEHLDELYEGGEKLRECLRFMCTSLRCTPRMRKLSPGAVHVDGTARPQILFEEDNPSFHRLLRLFYEKTGNPSLINTSFNMHEEPIVCSPDDACRAFLASGLPYLAINDFLVTRSESSLPL